MGLLDIIQSRRALGNDVGPGLGGMPLAGNINPRNPYLDWLRDNKGRITNGFAGMVGAGNDPRAALVGWTQGLRHGVDVDTENALIRQEEEEKQAALATTKAEQNATRAWIKKNAPQYADLPVAESLKLATAGGTSVADPASVAEYKFYSNQELAAGRSPLPYAEWRKGSNQTLRAGMGAPIWGKHRQTGEYMPFEPMSDGTITSLTDPSAKPADFLFDPGTVASDRAAGSGYGALQGPMQFNLPKAKQDVETELGHIDAVLGNKAGLEQSFGNLFGLNIGGVGYPNQWTPTVPNTPKAGFQAQIEQVKGENFLAAYNTLRGAGAITEQEGIQAKAAMARLDTAQSKEDFIAALTELKTILTRGYDRMSSQASMGPYQSSGYAPAPLSGTTLTYNPTTGELE